MHYGQMENLYKMKMNIEEISRMIQKCVGQNSHGICSFQIKSEWRQPTCTAHSFLFKTGIDGKQFSQGATY